MHACVARSHSLTVWSAEPGKSIINIKGFYKYKGVPYLLFILLSWIRGDAFGTLLLQIAIVFVGAILQKGSAVILCALLYHSQAGSSGYSSMPWPSLLPDARGFSAQRCHNTNQWKEFREQDDERTRSMADATERISAHSTQHQRHGHGHHGQGCATRERMAWAYT